MCSAAGAGGRRVSLLRSTPSSDGQGLDEALGHQLLALPITTTETRWRFSTSDVILSEFCWAVELPFILFGNVEFDRRSNHRLPSKSIPTPNRTPI
jgi:hypothetical protein